MSEQPAASLRALISSLIDYAGLFPPAKLDMISTVRNYAGYIGGEDDWMLGRLIVPAARLDEFETAIEALLPRSERDDPWQISALAAAAGDAQLETDIARIEEFNRLHAEPGAGLALIDVVELRADSPEKIDAALDLIPEQVFAFFEIPISQDPRGLIAALSGSEAGAKVRTGGEKPELYPTPPDLARFIAACASGEVPFKATAGMHHPLRHFSDIVKTHEHGFLNVFVAACMASAVELDDDEIARILSDESAASFRFEEDSLAWRDLHLPVAQIEAARESFAVSFGSCSFDEPRDDLRQMKLL